MFIIVAFDMDGTIADTIPMCIKAFRNSVSPYTDHELSKEEILHTFGLNEIGMVKAIVGQNWESAVEDFYCQYESLHNEVTSVFPGILKLIAFFLKEEYGISLEKILYFKRGILLYRRYGSRYKQLSWCCLIFLYLAADFIKLTDFHFLNKSIQ